MKKPFVVFLLLALCVLAIPSLNLKSSTPVTAAPSQASILLTSAHRVIRISQLDPTQYASSQEYDTWAASACSAASMTEVLNTYGRTLRITDVLQVESTMHAISPELGLLEESGIARTVAHFGFQTAWGHHFSLDEVIDQANHARPVIVGFPPQRAFPGGHLLVVTGGNTTTVFVADSSKLNVSSYSRTRFLGLWGGFAAIITPQVGGTS